MEGGRLQTRNKNGKMKVGRRKRRKNWDFPSGLWSTSTCCSQLKLIALAIPRFFRGHFSRNVDFRSPRGERERTSRSRGLTWPRHFQLVRRTKKPSPVQKPLPRLCDAIFFFFFFFFVLLPSHSCSGAKPTRIQPVDSPSCSFAFHPWCTLRTKYE